MAKVRVSCELKHQLVLPPGPYGEVLIEEGPTSSRLARVFESPTPEPSYEDQDREVDRLVSEANCLLRLYRVAAGHAQVTELTKADAGPFTFVADEQPWGPNEGCYEADGAAPYDPEVVPADVAVTVVAGLDKREEPAVWDLLLLDSELAIAESRYREAVLLAWSALESCFSKHLKDAVEARCGDLSKEEREGLWGPRDISLANKMTAGWALATGRSLHHQVGEDVWRQRQRCYRLRNAVVHEGGSASKDDAQQVLDFARCLVGEIAAKH